MSIYFIHTSSGQKGPFNLEELPASGVTKDTMIWREGLKDWIKAGDLPELSSLFITAPPPFVQKDTSTPITQKTAIATGNSSKNKTFLPVLIVLLILIALSAIYFLNRNKHKKDDADKEKIATTNSDSLAKKDTVKKDTVKKVNLDSLSNWMVTDSAGKEQKDTTTPGDFTMGGIPLKKEKDKKEKSKKEKINEISVPKENKPAKQTTNPQPEKREPEKALLISGGFRKNLLFEAVLEGTIQNPNSKTYHNIKVIVQFLNADGEKLGIKEFQQNGALGGGEKMSFKFKTNAPKGTKAARYSVSGD